MDVVRMRMGGTVSSSNTKRKRSIIATTTHHVASAPTGSASLKKRQHRDDGGVGKILPLSLSAPLVLTTMGFSSTSSSLSVINDKTASLSLPQPSLRRPSSRRMTMIPSHFFSRQQSGKDADGYFSVQGGEKTATHTKDRRHYLNGVVQMQHQFNQVGKLSDNKGSNIVHNLTTDFRQQYQHHRPQQANSNNRGAVDWNLSLTTQTTTTTTTKTTPSNNNNNNNKSAPAAPTTMKFQLPLVLLLALKPTGPTTTPLLIFKNNNKTMSHQQVFCEYRWYYYNYNFETSSSLATWFWDGTVRSIRCD